MKQSLYIDCRGKSEDYVKECCKELERLGYKEDRRFDLEYCENAVCIIAMYQLGYTVYSEDFQCWDDKTQITLEELRTLKNE